MDSILVSIKKLLGVDEYCDHFDTDIIIHINSALMVLNQLGVGPSTGFVVTSNSETWSDFLGENKAIESVKTYVYLKTRLVFDPPQTSSVIDAINRQISELEWRINVAVDPVSEETPDAGLTGGNASTTKLA